MMAFGRGFAPLVGWRPSRVREFLDLAVPAEQVAYWRRHLDTRRFRAATDALLSNGRPQHALRAGPFFAPFPENFGRVLRARMERCFARHPNRDNPYARRLLLGELSDRPRPREAKGIRLVQADAATCLESEPPGASTGSHSRTFSTGPADAYRAAAVGRRPARRGARRGRRHPQLRRTGGRVADEPCRRGPGDALGDRRRETGGRAVKPVRPDRALALASRRRS